MTGLPDLVGVPVELLEGLIRRLTDRRLTVATAESLTGGLLAALLTEIPGSSAVVRGGLIVYGTDLKHTLAGVDADVLADRGPVDPRVAAQLARGAQIRCGADIGVGLTGVAGPDPQNGIPVGTWFCAVHGPGGHTDERHSLPGAATAGNDRTVVDPRRVRAAVRAAAVRAALEMVVNIAAMDS